MSAISIGGRIFPSKAAAAQEVRTVLAEEPIGHVFESAFLSALVAEHHYYCKHHQDCRPSSFRKAHGRFGGGDAYELEGLFPFGWHDFSWKKCLQPVSVTSEVKAYLRQVAFDLTRDHRQGECVVCQGTDDVHAHHRDPTFNQMALEAIACLTKEEVETWAGHSWRTRKAFGLPQEHPAMRAFLAQHSRATIVPLCRACHIKEHSA